MQRRNFLATLLGVMMIAFIAFTAGSSTASAQCPPCPSGIAWTNYNYVYPPAPSGALTITYHYGGGCPDLVTNELADGHYTYPIAPDPPCPLISVTVSWAGPLPNSATFPVPCPKTTVPTPWGPLNVEIKCKPCVEVDVSY